ncbi:MAG: division/cell wall cluster transcriptional repressor MraZ [Planctomycetaceae bacterium]|jgi:MraZ protein|nr:division/cell wall cluster transcriptional repressor MraZ [Planctomycetia bacterium]PHY01983.1 MAG: division/cell wall cluster transcriptional repressor MraZ [Planctomycetaceae bacterium]
MSAATGLLIGEFIRTVDRRYRLAIPPELCELLLATGSRLVIAKERSGCLSLWPAAIWQPRIDGAIEIMGSKLQAGLFAQRVGQLQELGRLLSTRHKIVSLKARSRLVVPEGFREFLGVQPDTELVVVGAAVCVELWQPAAWNACISSEMPEFRRRIDALTA